MRRQAVVTLLVLALAAGLAVYAWATRSSGDRASETDPERVIWDAGEHQVREIVIERDGERIVLRPGPPPELVASPEMPFGGQGPLAAEQIGGLLAPDRWWVHEPRPVPVASEYASTLTENLRRLVAERVIAETAVDPAEYGLDRPSARVTVRFANSGDTRVLELGGDSPLSSGGAYARVAGGQKVWTISSDLAGTLRMSIDELRETMFVPFADDRVRAVEIRWGKERLAFQREEAGTSWKMQRDGRDAGKQDASRLSELWFALHQWRAEEVVSDGAREAAERARYGLDEPFGEIRLRFGGSLGKGAPELVLRVGKETPAGGRYVTTNEGPWVYALDPDDLQYFEEQVLPTLREPAAGKDRAGEGGAEGQDRGGNEGGNAGGQGR